MGKRSRKRMADGGDVAVAGGSTRAERDEARRQRAGAGGSPSSRRRSSRDERPPAPWGSFPLSELTIFVGIVLIVVGFFTGGDRGPLIAAAGLALGALGGLEVSVREHFAGYKSHSTLLAGGMAMLAITVVALAAGKVLVPILLGIGIAVFVASFVLFREAFRRRSGGVSFR